MATEAQPTPPVEDESAVPELTPSEPTAQDRVRAAARRAKSIWCGILSGLG